jgi:hypothetical protein
MKINNIKMKKIKLIKNIRENFGLTLNIGIDFLFEIIIIKMD